MKLKTYQQGGGLIYTPFIPEQEAVSSSGSSARSSGSDEDKIDPLDKEILNLMKGQDLLSSDINLIYDRLISFQRKTQSLSSLGGSTSYRSVMPGMLQLYSCQDLIFTSSSDIAVKASMKAFARRTLVIRGMLWSIAPRRIL